VAKLVHNCAGYIVQTALAEVFTMGVKAGVEPIALWKAVRQGAGGRRRTFDGLADQFLPGKFDPPSFALRLAHKDVSLATALGREHKVPMKLANITLEEMTEALNRGWAERDSRVAMLLQEERAGVQIKVTEEAIKEALGVDKTPPRLSPPPLNRPRADQGARPRVFGQNTRSSPSCAKPRQHVSQRQRYRSTSSPELACSPQRRAVEQNFRTKEARDEEARRNPAAVGSDDRGGAAPGGRRGADRREPQRDACPRPVEKGGDAMKTLMETLLWVSAMIAVAFLAIAEAKLAANRNETLVRDDV
jgi:hypothetical protein